MDNKTYTFSLRSLVGFGVLIIVLSVSIGGLILYAARDRFASYIVDSNELALSVPIAQDRDAVITDIVRSALPAVVSIVIKKDIAQQTIVYDELPWFGLRVPRISEGLPQEREIGGGTGFIVSADGLIVTNKHVIDDEDARYSIMLDNGHQVDATVVDQDPLYDLAILQISEPGDYPYLTFETQADVQLGQSVIAIGNALAEFPNSVSVGVISGLARSIVADDSQGGAETIHNLIQTDAAINLGNSGGPLINLSGKVVGVNVAVARSSENIGFSLPARLADQIVRSVAQYGKIIRPYLGIRYWDIDEEIVAELELPVTTGALIVGAEQDSTDTGVLADSPADKAGLQEGDIIQTIDGIQVDHNLSEMISSYGVGDTLEVTIWRDGFEVTKTVTLEAMPDEF
jgi:serine protease Do